MLNKHERKNRKNNQHTMSQADQLAAINSYQNRVNSAPIRITGESETTPALDQALVEGTIDVNPDLTAEIMSMADEETKQTNTEETDMNNEQVIGKAGDMTIDCSKVLNEGFDIPVGEATDVSDLDVVKAWVTGLDAPAFTKPTAFNIYTASAEDIINMFGLPTEIPTTVVDSLFNLVEAQPQVTGMVPMAKQVVAAIKTGDVVPTKPIIEFGLNYARSIITDKVLPMWESLSNNITTLLTPANTTPEQPTTPAAPVPPAPQPTVHVTAPAGVNIDVTITEEPLEPLAEVTEDAPKDPEVELAEWALANPGYSFDAYFNKRNELYGM